MSYRHKRMDTKTFRDLISTGWRIVWQARATATKVFVRLAKIIEENEVVQNLIVVSWALPKKEKKKKRVQQPQERRGIPKSARMAYC